MRKGQYIVTNDEALSMVATWKASSGRARSIAEGKVITKLSYLVHSRIRRHRDRPFYDDLLQEGRLGIVSALHDFDPERGENFFQFASWHVRTRVRRWLLREVRRPEIPCGSETIAMVAPEAPRTEDAYEAAEARASLGKAIAFLLPSERSRKIMRMRFGIDGGGCRTLQEIGEDLGVTRERVRQLERAALEILKGSDTMADLAKEMSIAVD